MFHSAVAGMKFTPSVLAKMFSRKITTWDHADILAVATFKVDGFVIIH